MKFAILDFKDLSLKLLKEKGFEFEGWRELKERSGLLRGIVEFLGVDILIFLNIFYFNN
jgi:hypothetical protein